MMADQATEPPALAELRRWPRWVMWRTVERDGKPTKVPLMPNGRAASSTDPETWSSYETCAKALERGSYDGVGYVFAEDDEYAGVDLDKCVQVHAPGSFAAAAGPNIDSEAWKVVRQLDSYTEFSPTGTGLHILVRAGLNGGRKKTDKTPWKGAFENYDRERFFTITGRHVAGTPVVIEPRQKQLDAVRAQMFPAEKAKTNGKPLLAPEPTTLDDVALEEKIRSSKQGSKFADLFDRGAAEGQESEADLALCNILAFWIGPDESRIDAWFRRSALMRDKWDAKRGDTTYGGYTIARSLEGRTEFYGQKKPTPTQRSEGESNESASTTTKTAGGGSKLLPAWLPDEDDPAERYVVWLNELWGLEGERAFVSAERFGKHGDAAIVLVRESGQRVRWAHQSTLQKPAGLQAVLMSECGIRPRKFSGHDVMLIAWAITQLADLKADIDPLEEIALWWLRYVDSRPTRNGNPDHEDEWRKLLAAWQIARAADEASSMGERQTFIVRDDRTGEHYVRREDYADHVRAQVKGPLSWPTLNSRLAEAGWQQTRVQRKATAAGAPYVEARLYVVPAGWPDAELASKVGG